MQFRGPLPTQTPPEQISTVLQALPSLHGALLFTVRQPRVWSQKSSVHTFPSLHTGGGPPTHIPKEQTSFVVQALPSLHGEVLLVKTQPLAGLQVSSVQPFASLQTGGGPPRQTPPEQASPVVHAFPSLQGLVLLMCVQPMVESHPSSVHTFPSSQLGGAPLTHAPPEQTSPVVQAFPSLHGAVLLV